MMTMTTGANAVAYCRFPVVVMMVTTTTTTTITTNDVIISVIITILVLLIVLLIPALLVEVRQRIANVLEDDVGRDGAEGELVHADGLDEARQRHSLELGVYEVADGLGEGAAVGPARQRLPVQLDGHCVAL